MFMFDFAYWLEKYQPKIEFELKRHFEDLQDVPAKLKQAMEYAVFPGGKRLRCYLVLAGAEALGKEPGLVLPVAIAVEFIHCYSLVHDDLPCMDNDSLRRGLPACHIQFGEATALLAGNALLTLAFEVLLKGAQSLQIDSSRVMQVLSSLFKAIGAQGMIGGQAYEFTLQPPVSLTEINQLHKMKTVALIKAAASLPALWLGIGDAGLNNLSLYGENLGMAFQIIDDLNDSKTKDEAVNYAKVVSEAEASRLADYYLAQALESLKIFGSKAEPLRGLAELVKNNRI
jgi:geranylgeranyl pyrophosphate synthase